MQYAIRCHINVTRLCYFIIIRIFNLFLKHTTKHFTSFSDLEYVTDGSSDVCFYYIVFPHMMLIIFFCLCCFFYLTSVFPSTTFAKIIHQVTSYQEPINAFSDDKLLDSKSD